MVDSALFISAAVQMRGSKGQPVRRVCSSSFLRLIERDCAATTPSVAFCALGTFVAAHLEPAVVHQQHSILPVDLSRPEIGAAYGRRPDDVFTLIFLLVMSLILPVAMRKAPLVAFSAASPTLASGSNTKRSTTTVAFSPRVRLVLSRKVTCNLALAPVCRVVIEADWASYCSGLTTDLNLILNFGDHAHSLGGGEVNTRRKRPAAKPGQSRWRLLI